MILHEGKVLLNHSVSELSGNLRFSVSGNRPEDGDGLIYTERTVGGHASVWKDHGGGEGGLDLELLFKAAIANPVTRAALLATENRK